MPDDVTLRLLAALVDKINCRIAVTPDGVAKVIASLYQPCPTFMDEAVTPVAAPIKFCCEPTAPLVRSIVKKKAATGEIGVMLIWIAAKLLPDALKKARAV